MIELLDGPAQGVFNVRRAPFLLRAVLKPDGSTDVLDQLDDIPERDETLHVYYEVSLGQNVGVTYVCSRGRGQGGSGPYASAHYRHIPGVEGEAVRQTSHWREWARANYSRIRQQVTRTLP